MINVNKEPRQGRGFREFSSGDRMAKADLVESIREGRVFCLECAGDKW